MNKRMESIASKINSLTPNGQRAVENFVNVVFQKEHAQVSHRKKISTKGWRGALSHLKDKYTSVELQHGIFKKHDGAFLSEEALARDWLRPEEDKAWAHLQKGQ